MLLTSIILFFLLLQEASPSPPPFSQYPATVFHGPLHRPELRTTEERRFRTTLTRAITRGYGVVEGGTEHERPGPNFAGHYLLVQWSCGLDCTEAAVIDAVDGTVLPLPTLPHRQSPPSFLVEIGPADLRTLQFRSSSRLLRFPNIADGMTYSYALNKHTWTYLSRTTQPGSENVQPATPSSLHEPIPPLPVRP